MNFDASIGGSNGHHGQSTGNNPHSLLGHDMMYICNQDKSVSATGSHELCHDEDDLLCNVFYRNFSIIVRSLCLYINVVTTKSDA